MKKILLSLMIAGAGLAVKAQETGVKFGVKAGVTLPKLSISEDDGGMIKSNLSFYVGGTVELPVADMFSIQSGLTFIGKGSKLDINESVEGAGISSNVKTNLWYVELPVNALVSFPVGEGKVFVGAGPYYSMAIGGKNKGDVTMTMGGDTETESVDQDIKFGKDGDFKRGDFGVNFLAGYQLSSGFNIHAGYGLGLANISPESDGFKTKNRVISFGVGFSF